MEKEKERMAQKVDLIQRKAHMQRDSCAFHINTLEIALIETKLDYQRKIE